MRMYLILVVFYKIMKKFCMWTILGSSGSDCVLIILFQLYDSKAGLFEWVIMTLQPSYWKKS